MKIEKQLIQDQKLEEEIKQIEGELDGLKRQKLIEYQKQKSGTVDKFRGSRSKDRFKGSNK